MGRSSCSGGRVDSILPRGTLSAGTAASENRMLCGKRAPQVPAAADDQDGAHVRALLQPAPQLRDFVQRSQRPHRKAFGAPRGTVVIEKKEPSLRRNTALQLQEARPCGEVKLCETG